MSRTEEVRRVRRPPCVVGTVGPRLGDVWSMVWWAERGFVLTARDRRVPGRSRVYYGVAAVLWWPMFPVALVAELAATARPSARYYLSPGRDAVLAVASRRGVWCLEDHASARPGSGRGRELRAAVLPTLLHAADAAGIPIEATAATDQLAAIYQAELPELTDRGAGRIRGRKLRRDPRPRRI